MKLRVQFFGQFRLWKDQEELTPLLTHLGKPKTLLKIFITHPGRIFAPDELIEWLWPDLSPATGASNLRKRISELRQAFEPGLTHGAKSAYFLTRTGGYCFNNQIAYTADTHEFLERWESGQRTERAGHLSQALQEYETAAALIQGDFLAEDRQASWASALASEWEERHLMLYAHLASAYTRLGQYDRALDFCEKGLKTRPWREDLFRWKMLARYHAGEHDQALQTYQEYLRALQEHLGAEPSSEMTALHQHIVNRDLPAPTRAIPHNLPVALTSFVGRQRELAQVKKALTQTRLLTLTGPGGCGKTRLALETAAQILQEFPDGVWLVETATVTDPALVPQVVSSALRLREKPGAPLTTHLAEFLRSKTLLLILDNCEHLVKACAHLAETLLQSAPHLRILATSREGLALSAETLWPVPPLSVPETLSSLPSLTQLQEYEGIRLFVERARSTNIHLEFAEQSVPALVQICTQLDGIPLAIELAAARVRVLSLQQIADRLGDRFRLLTGGSRTALPRQQTLQAAMDWSWDLLTESEKILLRRLSVFRGGFTAEAAPRFCADAETKPHPCACLSHLVDKSLVVTETQKPRTRYRLLETVRQYGQAKLNESGESQSIRDRHLEFFLKLAEVTEPELHSPQQTQWLDRLEEEHDNFRAALEWALSQTPHEMGLRLAGALGRFWEMRNFLSEGRHWLAQALIRCEQVSTGARAKALAGAGGLAWRQGDFKHAILCHEEAVKAWREVGDKQGLAISINSLGLVAHTQGEYKKALTLFEESLALRREINDQWGIAASLQNLGLVAYARGDYSHARSLYEESLAIRKEVGDRRGVAALYHNLGEIARLQQEHARARSLLEESLAISRELGDRQGIANSLQLLGNIVGYQDLTRAQSLFEESLAIQRELGNQANVASALNNLSLVLKALGQYDQAYRLLEESLALRRQLGDKPGQASSLNNLGFLLTERGDTSAATALFEESLKLYRELGHRQGIAGCLVNLGEMALLRQDSQQTQQYFTDGLRLARDLQNQLITVTCLEGLAAVASQHEDFDRAVSLLGAADTLRSQLTHKRSFASQAIYEKHLALARSRLGEEAMAAALTRGSVMALEQAVALALKDFA
jgi:predicted ATPase/DNA-binding SARP family transcriptional activator